MQDNKIFRCRQYVMGCHTIYNKDSDRIFKESYSKEDFEKKREACGDGDEEQKILNEITDLIKNNYICDWCDGQFPELINENMPCWNDQKICKNEQGKNSKERQKIREEYYANV